VIGYHPNPPVSKIREHLVEVHGMPGRVLDQHEPGEWRSWHDAEHRTRKLPKKPEDQHPGHLRHWHTRKAET
jgi:hypothetical protein